MTPTPDLETPAPPEPESTEQSGQAESPYGVNNRDLPKQLVDAIRAAIEDFQKQEKAPRRREIKKDRRHRLYDEGHQHLQWNDGANGGWSLLTPGGWAQTANGNQMQCPQYMRVWNIYHGFLWVWISVVTQSTPGVEFEPDDPSKSEDIDAAKAAEGYAEAFDRYNDTHELQVEIARMMGVSGRVVSWTRTEQDGQKFGYEPDGTPKRFQRTTIHGTLESKVQISCREFDGNTPYLFLYLDHDLCILKDRYPWIEKEIKASTPALAESMYERNARLGIVNGMRSQTGDQMGHMGTEGHYFLRPAAFHGSLYDNVFDSPEAGDENEDGTAFTVRDKLNQLYPEGVRAVFVGDVYAESFAESMDDHCEIQFPFPGDGLARMAVMDPMITVQDNFNDMGNWAEEKFDTGAGSLWINADDAEWEAIQNQKASPNALRQKKLPGTGAKMEDQFFQENDPELPATFIEFLEMIYGPLPQFMLACPPALFGEQMPDQKTASGYAQARNQATGRLGLIYGRMQRMFARIRYQSALAASKEPTETKLILIPGKGGQNKTVNLEALSKGNFHCYPDQDSSFPESTQQKRATLANFVTLIGQNPAALQMFMSNPDNLEAWIRLEGISDITLTPAEARDKQVFEIEQLLAASPILPTPEDLAAATEAHAAIALQAQTAGQPGPGPFAPPLPHSSVPIGPFDFHPFELAKVQEWLSSAERREADARPNLAPEPQLDPLCQKFGCRNYGVLNVILHGMEHQKAIPPPPVPMPVVHAAPPPAHKPAESTNGGPPPAPAAPAAPLAA